MISNIKKFIENNKPSAALALTISRHYNKEAIDCFDLIFEAMLKKSKAPGLVPFFASSNFIEEAPLSLVRKWLWNRHIPFADEDSFRAMINDGSSDLIKSVRRFFIVQRGFGFNKCSSFQAYLSFPHNKKTDLEDLRLKGVLSLDELKKSPKPEKAKAKGKLFKYRQKLFRYNGSDVKTEKGLEAHKKLTSGVSFNGFLCGGYKSYSLVSVGTGIDVKWTSYGNREAILSQYEPKQFSLEEYSRGLP